MCVHFAASLQSIWCILRERINRVDEVNISIFERSEKNIEVLSTVSNKAAADRLPLCILK